MQAIIFSVMFPVVPLLIWMNRHKEKASAKDLLIRYAVYTLLMSLLSSVIMVFFCDEGISFWGKADASPKFVLKYAGIEILTALSVAAAEWIYTEKKIKIQIQWQEYRQYGPVRFAQKILFPAGIYLTAAAVVLLNISLMGDNVLWGDECFSANTAQKSAEGILQVLYFWDNHPPLYYYWLKLFGDLFGHTGPIYHLASLIPFFSGVVLAVTLFRKRFGSIPAAFFVIVTGLASSCLRYNLEIRMYSLAFFGIICSYYCAYRILSGGKAAWPALVFWALVSAYSHYYALVSVGIMMFITYVAAAIRRGGKTWIKGLASMLVFLIGYAPWMSYLFHATGSVSQNWWMTEVLSLRDSLQMVLCGEGMQQIVICFLAVSLVVIFFKESSFFQLKREEETEIVQVHTPSLKNWSDDAYGAAVGGLTIIGTLIAAYMLCLIMGPLLAQRYLYPLSAVTVLLLVICSSHDLEILEEWGSHFQKKWFYKAGKCLLVFVLIILAAVGIKNYKAYSAEVKTEKAYTEETLYLIGEVPENTKLVSNNVKHLGWTVLAYYFPEREIINGSCENDDIGGSNFWYFTSDFMSQEQLDMMMREGYIIAGYGEKRISIYPFVLYYFEKEASSL